MWADEVVYKTALFGSGYNPTNQDYTSSFDATNGDFVVTATNFNNNNNGWTNSAGFGQIKCGRKNNASVGTITTKAAIDQAITKVVVTIDAITASKVNSIKLYTSSNGTSWTEAGSYTIATGAQTVTLASPAANLYYKVEFDCASGSSNGLVTVSKVEYYYDTNSGTIAPSDLALTDAPVELSFDLYNNASAQTVSYTTSSTGAITVSESEYITTTINNGTITVTPVKVTPSAQTITVSQAADDDYAAGSVSFTVSITDSTPFEGGDVTFVAGTDKGTTTVTGPDEMTKSGVTISSTSAALGTTEYRLYSGSTTTISTSSGKITKIQFTQSSNTYPVSKLSTETGNYNGTSGIWVGEATSVDFSASAQVRASQIVVTISVSNKQSAGLVYETTEYTVNLGETFNAPTLTNPNNLTVSYASSNQSVATVDAGTGAVTLQAAGTTTITATSAETEEYLEGSASYTLTVIDPSTPGSENNPFSVAEALAAITNGDFDADTYYYVSGIISQIDEVNTTQYYNATYFISDDGQTTTQLEVYRGKYLDNANFTSADQIQVGDEVVIYGKLQYYNNETPEIAQGNYITSLDRKEVKYYLAGSWGENNSGWGEGMEQLTKSGNTYTISKNLANGTLFKIVKVDETNGDETTWYGGLTDNSNSESPYGIHSGWYENIPLTNSQDNSYVKNFKIEGSCDDKFTFTVDASDPDNLKLTVTGWHVPEVKYYLGGDWTENWADGKVVLTENSDGTFSCSKQVGNGTRFKFFKTTDGVLSTYGANRQGEDWGVHSEACTNIPLMEAENTAAFVIQMASDNELVFKLNPTNMTFNVTGWPISIEGNMFVKVTSDADFTDGAYLIVYEEDSLAFDGSLGTLDAEGNVIPVTITNNSIVADATTKASLFTIVDGGKVTSASGHYIGVNGQNNGLLLDNDATSANNSVTIDANGNADIAINTSGTNFMHLAYNSQEGQNRFRYYKNIENNVVPIQLYKLVTLPMNDIVITSAEWATYVPNLAVTIPEDVTAYIVTNATSTSVTLSSVASAPANTGLVVNGDEGTYTPTAAETTDDVSGNLLVVSDGTVVGNGNIYALGNKNGSVGFKKVKSGVTVPAGKPYLTIENTGSKDFFDFSFDEGVATGIESIESIGFDMNAPVYDLQGRQVNRLHKGVFIQNGKKIIVK